MTLPQPAPAVVDVPVDDEQVLWLDGDLHLLDPPGALVWRLLPLVDSVQALVQLVAEVVDADPEDVREGVVSLLGHLTELGALSTGRLEEEHPL